MRWLGEWRTGVVLGVMLVTFAAGFGSSNPHALLHPGEFVSSLEGEKEIMEFGHTLREDPRGAMWLVALAGVTGKVHTWFLVGYLLVGAYVVLRGGRMPGIQGVLLVWVAVFVGYLMLEVNLRRARHLLPVLPCVLLFVGQAYWSVLVRVRDRVRYC